MLQPHLRPLALKLDEQNFEVDLGGREFEANSKFFDGSDFFQTGIDAFMTTQSAVKLAKMGVHFDRSQRVLDVCSGHGSLGAMIHKRFGSSVSFCDLSRFQLTSLRDKRRKLFGEGNGNQIIQADINRIPAIDGAFDGVVGNSFLHHLPCVHETLKELRRVVKPGGFVVLPTEPGIYATFWQSFPLSVFRNTNPKEGFVDLWLFSANDLRRLFRDAGFTDVYVFSNGILSSLATNWYALSLMKLGINKRSLLAPVFGARLAILRWEAGKRRGLLESLAPFYSVVARRPTE